MDRGSNECGRIDLSANCALSNTARELHVRLSPQPRQDAREICFPQDVTVPSLPKPTLLAARLQPNSCAFGELFTVCKAMCKAGTCSVGGSFVAPALHKDACWKS